MESDPYNPPLAKYEASNRYALTALRERRALMTGELVKLDNRRRYLKDAMRHLDATLAMMSPGYDPTLIKAKFPRRKSKLFGKGKLNAMILDAMRRADRPMSIADVSVAVAEAMGFDSEAAEGLKPRVRSALLYLTSVREMLVKEGEREATRWKIAPSPACLIS